MRPSPPAILSLLLLGPSPATAAPHDHVGVSIPHHPPRPWRRLSDAIIRTIWGSPEQQKSLELHHDTPGAAAPGAPQGKLFARYGDDMVMRFTIRTAEEASALAEAAHVLFLDVWEFRADWVDIRLAKDVVSIGTTPSGPPHTIPC